MKIAMYLSLMMIFSLSALAQKETYFISKTVQLSFEEATVKTKEVLKKQGFGIVAESDMDKMLSEKIGVTDMKPYRVLGACNAKIAHRAILAEENVAIFLPCKVILKYITAAKTEVVFVNPRVAMQAIKNKEAQAIFKEAADLMAQAMTEL